MTDVKFINNSPDVKKTLEGLSKTALRECGKIIRKNLRQNVPVRTKNFKNHIASWAFINRKTGQPELQVGFYGWQKVKSRGKTPSRANPHWVEFGTKSHTIKSKYKKGMGYNDEFYGKSANHPGTKATHVLRNSVFDNIDAIRAKQEELLKYLSETLDIAAAKVDTGEEVEDD